VCLILTSQARQVQLVLSLTFNQEVQKLITFMVFAVGDFQNLTNVLDANGGPREYHFLQDLLQRQDINNLLFGIYKNGAISYASVGFSQEAAVSYGFKGFSTDTFDFHFHRYKGFTAPALFGYVPTQGDYAQTSVLPYHRV
jgi:hypothetical protein